MDTVPSPCKSLSCMPCPWQCLQFRLKGRMYTITLQNTPWFQSSHWSFPALTDGDYKKVYGSKQKDSPLISFLLSVW